MSDGRKPSVAFALGLGLVMTACSMSSTPPAEPSPEFAPREVVDIVLTALRSNNEPAPDTGIATAFAFASPGNRESTGPLPRFIQMIEAGYAPLIDHRSAEFAHLTQSILERLGKILWQSGRGDDNPVNRILPQHPHRILGHLFVGEVEQQGAQSPVLKPTGEEIEDLSPYVVYFRSWNGPTPGPPPQDENIPNDELRHSL